MTLPDQFTSARSVEGVDCESYEIGAATRQRPAPRHQELRSMMQGKPTALERIIADNDPRNGTIVNRLIRMIEHPEREPDGDGLYRDELSLEGGS